MKTIEFSQHALDQLFDRGITKEEVISAIREGEAMPAKKGRMAYRKNFPFESLWKGKFYEIKQVMPVVVEENDKYIVVTAYAYYFGGEGK